MTPLLVLAHLAALLGLPILLTGVINRVKARWAGRVGPPLLQSAHDLYRLLKKETVVSRVATGFVQAGPIVLLGSTLVAGALTPLVNGWAPLACPLDFVIFAYLLALGRTLMVLAALDTGSAFEGMGASREAQYAALIEPGFFLVLGALALASGKTSFAELFVATPFEGTGLVIRACAFVACLIALQVECARVPVDDPNTHLELTMIHEVMVLDHSGPDLAFVQYAAALKLTLLAALAGACLNPFSWSAAPLAATASSLVLMLGVAALVGLIESLVARLRLSALPRYMLVATLAGLCALGAQLLGRGG